MAKSIVPKHGERALVIGQTGSGKTAFARFLLSKMPGSIIYDTKTEPKFKTLTNVVVSNVEQAIQAFKKDEELNYVIVQPPVHVTFDPKLLDEMLMEHYERCRNVTAYIDEVFQFHVGGKSRVAHIVWKAFGDVPNYVEPFFGSGAVLLGRPHEPKIETVNDADALLSNFWRSIKAAPDEVAKHAGWTVHAWKAPGGYGSQGSGRGRENAHRERIWFSPHCLPLEPKQRGLFE